MITIYRNMIQGSDEWTKARLGILTASEMRHVITAKTLKPAENEEKRAHVFELLAQRVTGFVEPHFVSDDMARGNDDENDALAIYEDNYEMLDRVGFITNDKWGFTLGYSPDALVGDHGIVEVKSRRQKFQIATIINNECPSDFMIQIQTGLLVSERKWCDFISFSAGLPMATIRVEENPATQAAIVDAARTFSSSVDSLFEQYAQRMASPLSRLVLTERKNLEMFV